MRNTRNLSEFNFAYPSFANFYVLGVQIKSNVVPACLLAGNGCSPAANERVQNCCVLRSYQTNKMATQGQGLNRLMVVVLPFFFFTRLWNKKMGIQNGIYSSLADNDIAHELVPVFPNLEIGVDKTYPILEIVLQECGANRFL